MCGRLGGIHLTCNRRPPKALGCRWVLQRHPCWPGLHHGRMCFCEALGSSHHWLHWWSCLSRGINAAQIAKKLMMLSTPSQCTVLVAFGVFWPLVSSETLRKGLVATAPSTELVKEVTNFACRPWQ